MTELALDQHEKGPDKGAQPAGHPDQAKETLYYEMDNAIYGVREGVVFALSRNCEWEEMGEGAQLHMADSLEMRAYPATFDQIRQLISSADIFEGEVKPL